MKNKEIFNLYRGLQEISQNKKLIFNIKTTYILAKNKNLLEPYYNAIIEARQKIIGKYGKLNENGNWEVPKGPIMDDFIKEWDEFMDIQNSLVLDKIKLEDFGSNEIDMELIERLLPIINN